MIYTVPLALVDFFPVIFSGLGLWFLSRVVAQAEPPAASMATLGAILVTLGGSCKAVWKLVLAGTGTNLSPLDQLLFIFMGPGFALMAAALLRARRAERGRAIARSPWPAPVVIATTFLTIALFFASQGNRRWNTALLALTVIASNITGIVAGGLLCRRKHYALALCFAFNLVAALVLARLARIDQTITLQWFEETLNTTSQAAFAFAAWRLSKAPPRVS